MRQIPDALKIAAVFSTFLIFATGCGITKQPFVFEGAAKPREAMAMEAMGRLREAFNDGACEAIFEGADEVFRVSQTRQGWLRQCAGLRSTLGAWERTDARASVPNPVRSADVVVDGVAVFANGDYRLRAVWHLGDGRAQLFFLYLNRGLMHIRIPPAPIRRPPGRPGVSQSRRKHPAPVESGAAPD